MKRIQLILFVQMVLLAQLFAQKTIFTDNFESTAFSETTGGGFPSNFICTGQNVFSVYNASYNLNKYADGATSPFWRTMYSSGSTASKTFSVQAFAENRTGGTGTQCMKVTIPDAAFETSNTIRLNTETGKVSFIGGSNAGAEGKGKYTVSCWLRTDGANKTIIKGTSNLTITSTWTQYTFDTYVTGTGSTQLAIDFIDIGSDYVIYFDDFKIVDNTIITSAITTSGQSTNTYLADGINYFSNLTIENGGTLTVNIASIKTLGNITINTGGKLTINSHGTALRSINMKPGGTIENNGAIEVKTDLAIPGQLNLLSDATGTATMKGSGTYTGNINVQQYLPQGRNWYVSSPVSGATSSVLSTGTSVVSYSEPTAAWITESSTLTPGKGYISVSNSGTGTSNVTFSGTPNNGNVNITLTRQGATKAGFNLVGNPYPSYLDARTAVNNNSNLESTIWYRTRSTGGTPTYYFETVNTSTGVGTNNAATGTVTGLIPPMQGFWVRTKNDNETLAFSNSLRSHAGTASTDAGNVSTTVLKSRNQNLMQVLRLVISNTVNSDETIIYYSDNASDNLDIYDSHKMSNGSASIAELYTIVDNETLVINGKNTSSINQTIPLGYSTGASNSLSIRASEIKNFDADLAPILTDHQLNVDFDLSAGDAYLFTSEAANTTDRFSVAFKSKSVATSLTNTAKLAYEVFASDLNTIQVKNTEGTSAQLMITDISGRRMITEALKAKSTNSYTLQAGIYLVTVTGENNLMTRKIILE